jgi:hypothetical protein
VSIKPNPKMYAWFRDQDNRTITIWGETPARKDKRVLAFYSKPDGCPPDISPTIELGVKQAAGLIEILLHFLLDNMKEKKDENRRK